MILKKIITLSLVFFTIILASCEDELNKLTEFTISNKSEFSIPSTTIIDVPLGVPTPEVAVNSEEEFDSNNSRKDLIESAKLKKLTLDIKSPDSGNFDFLNEIEIYINAEGLEETLIASIYDIPEDQLTTLNLDTENTELSSYLKKDSYSMSFKVKVDKTIETEYVIEADSDIFIDAKILGI